MTKKRKRRSDIPSPPNEPEGQGRAITGLGLLLLIALFVFLPACGSISPTIPGYTPTIGPLKPDCDAREDWMCGRHIVGKTTGCGLCHIIY